jgi:hypothetical protein
MRVSQSQARSTTRSGGNTWGRLTTWGRRPLTTWGRRETTWG